jgi:tetratricopeptide (TPR) repeat protein
MSLTMSSTYRTMRDSDAKAATGIRGRRLDRRDKGDRVMETRSEQNAACTRDVQSSDRDGIIDLTNDESSKRGVDPEASDARVVNIYDVAEEGIELEQPKAELPLSEVRVTKVRDKADIAAIEMKRKRLKERLEDSKEKMDKSKISKSYDKTMKEGTVKKSEKRGKKLIVDNSLLHGDSGSTQRDSIRIKCQLSKKNGSGSSDVKSSLAETPTNIDQIHQRRVPDYNEFRTNPARLQHDGPALLYTGRDPSEEMESGDADSGNVLNEHKSSSSPEVRGYSVADNHDAIEVSPAKIKCEEVDPKNNSKSFTNEDHDNNGCTWYLCSGGDKESPSTFMCSGAEKEPQKEQESEAIEGDINDTNLEPSAEPGAASDPNVTKGLAVPTEPVPKIVDRIRNFVSTITAKSTDMGEQENTHDLGTTSRTPKVWDTLIYWIDPAPSVLIKSLMKAKEARKTGENEMESIPTDIVLESSNNGSAQTDNQSAVNPIQALKDDLIEAPALFQSADSLEENFDGKDDNDQDSGTISDAGLNSMPALDNSKENTSINGAQQFTVSAFDLVKPACLSPAASLENSPLDHDDDDDDISRNIVNDDDESTASATNIFGDDLKSVPSVKDDITEGVSELQADDLGPSEPLPDSPSIAAKMEKLKLKETKKLESKNAYKAKADQSIEARRQTLVKDLRSAISTFGRYDIRCANITASLGDVLDEGGDHLHAVRLHRDATTIYSSKLGDDHSTTLMAKMRLGAVLENSQQYDEAINMYYLVTVMRRARLGENDPSVADGLVQMAQVLKKKSDFLQAIKELKRALKVYRESLGDAHEKVANTVDQIASLYVTVGDFDKSAAILEEVVKLKAATIGMSTKAVAQTLCTLATTYECSEKFNSAMKALKKAYKIYTEIGGYSSEDSTTTLNRIAQLYEATGDQNRASIAYLGVLRARKILRGADSLSVGETYFRLGHSLRETGQFDKALKCLKEALPIFVGQGVEMNDMKMVADIMHEMAFINQDKGNYQDAVRIFRQELSVRRKIGQPEFPLVARTLNHLGVAEFELKNNSRALKYLVEALTIFQERGEQGIECAEVLFNTGLVFDAVLNRERALEAYIEAARLFRDHGYKEDHPHLTKAVEKIEKAQSIHVSK